MPILYGLTILLKTLPKILSFFICQQVTQSSRGEDEEESIVGPPLPARHHVTGLDSPAGAPLPPSGCQAREAVDGDGPGGVEGALHCDDLVDEMGEVRPRSYSKAKPLTGENR